MQTRLPTSANLDFWIKSHLNVLFIGKRGIGKTEMTKEKFEEHFPGRWLYFSASTMDPWVDFVGVPKEVTDENGNTYLDLVRPKALQDDEVEAIMIDEYNRAPAKVRNAIMELVQFKSINGKKYKNLKIIWAAINPDDDDTYDVERLDPAQKDRFQIQVNLPYQVNVDYFKKVYGPLGASACAWWNDQDEAIREEISPRRLSYVLDVFNAGGDISYVLPMEGVNYEALVTILAEGSYIERLKKLAMNNDPEEIRESFQNENFYFGTEKLVLKDQNYIRAFVPHFPKEKLVKLALENDKVMTYLIENEDYRNFINAFDPILNQHKRYQAAKKDGSGGTKPFEYKSVQIKFSEIGKITRWREKTIPAGELSDVDFIDLVSNKIHNIKILSDSDKRNDIVNRFGKILADEIILDKEYYEKMAGVSCELIERVDAQVLPFVFINISKIDEIMKANNMGSFKEIYGPQLQGFRRGTTGTIFDVTTEKLIANGFVDKREEQAAA